MTITLSTGTQIQKGCSMLFRLPSRGANLPNKINGEKKKKRLENGETFQYEAIFLLSGQILCLNTTHHETEALLVMR